MAGTNTRSLAYKHTHTHRYTLRREITKEMHTPTNCNVFWLSKCRIAFLCTCMCACVWRNFKLTKPIPDPSLQKSLLPLLTDIAGGAAAALLLLQFKPNRKKLRSDECGFTKRKRKYKFFLKMLSTHELITICWPYVLYMKPILKAEPLTNTHTILIAPLKISNSLFVLKTHTHTSATHQHTHTRTHTHIKHFVCLCG